MITRDFIIDDDNDEPLSSFLRLGFEKNNYTYSYISLFEKKIKESGLRIIKETHFDKRTGNEVVIYAQNPLTEILNIEIQFRENLLLKDTHLNKSSRITSATDMSNFAFCPASFSISETFKIEQNPNMQNGLFQHKYQHLIDWKNQLKKADFDSNYYPNMKFINEESKAFFKDVKDSNLIYSGHKNEEKRLFYNKNKNFVGDPDYIFQKANGELFIVEEKFKSENSHINFHHNNKIQLLSYIHGIQEYKANYGYLIYWFKTDETLNCKVTKIIRSNNDRDILNDIFNKIKKLKEGNKLPFTKEDLNISKCINCSYNWHCGHKTGNFIELEFPYSKTYLEVKK